MHMTTEGAEVSLREVTKRYRMGEGSSIVATDSVSLNIEAGSTVALMGTSGSGKSTLLHLVGAMDELDDGSIVVDGVQLSTLSRRQLADYRRRVGFIFQRFHLLPALSALDNVTAPLLPFRTTFDRRQRALGLLDAVGLKGREQSLPSQLSGGQQQRVAIARALLNQPNLLLADEPTGNLDTATSRGVLDLLLLDLKPQTPMTIVLATHDPEVAQRCDRIIRLEDGKVTD